MTSNHQPVTQPTIGLTAATAVVIGNMIGVGVFTSLGFQLFSITHGFPVILLWVLGGVYALCGALCYAELTAAFPRSGGEYHLLKEVFHPAVGFASGWLSMTVGFAAPVALAAMAFGSYLHNVNSGLDAKALSCVMVALVTMVHLWKVKVSGAFQSVLTAAKVALILVLIGAAFFTGSGNGYSFAPQAGDWEQIKLPAFAVSLIFVTYAYAGWNGAVYIAGEIKNPQRNVPLALLIGTSIVAVLYVAVNAAFLHRAPVDELVGKPEVALVAARHIFGEDGGNLMGLLIAFGLISAVSAMTWAGPRTSMVIGQDFPKLRFLGRTNVAGVPYFAILIQAFITIMLLLAGTFKAVLLYVEFALLLSLSTTVLGVIWLRIRNPKLDRPYRTPFYPLPPLLFLAMNIYIGWHTWSEHPIESGWGLTTIAAGVGIYFLLVAGTPKKDRT
jgi:APA family basic amino acid/polyamine antiporter